MLLKWCDMRRPHPLRVSRCFKSSDLGLHLCDVIFVAKRISWMVFFMFFHTSKSHDLWPNTLLGRWRKWSTSFWNWKAANRCCKWRSCKADRKKTFRNAMVLPNQVLLEHVGRVKPQIYSNQAFLRIFVFGWDLYSVNAIWNIWSINLTRTGYRLAFLV